MLLHNWSGWVYQKLHACVRSHIGRSALNAQCQRCGVELRSSAVSNGRVPARGVGPQPGEG